MKSLFIILLCMLLAGLGLCICGPKSYKDPYFCIIKEYQGYMDYENYAIYDIDDNGMNELLLGNTSIYTIYTIQNGVAVQQDYHADHDDYAFSSIVYINGVVKSERGDPWKTDLSYYRFEDGELKCQVRLTHIHDNDMVNEYYRHYLDGTKEAITKEEFDRVKAEFEGDGQEVELDWKPLRRYRRR